MLINDKYVLILKSPQNAKLLGKNTIFLTKSLNVDIVTILQGFLNFHEISTE